MAQNYRIYIYRNTITIANTLPKTPQKLLQLDFQQFNLPAFFATLSKRGHSHYVILHHHPQAFFKQLKKQCLYIKAAGGLVREPGGSYLFIFRNKTWDLPKGKLERGEKLKQTAVREVSEECGIEPPQLKSLLCKTYHMYLADGVPAIKKTNWYSMVAAQCTKPKPQLTEGITRAEWVPATAIPGMVQNTFGLVKDVLESAGLLQE